jgi:hypothetical protein
MKQTQLRRGGEYLYSLRRNSPPQRDGLTLNYLILCIKILPCKLLNKFYSCFYRVLPFGFFQKK